VRRFFSFALAATISLGVFGCSVSADENEPGQSTDSLETGHRWKVLDVQYQAQSTRVPG